MSSEKNIVTVTHTKSGASCRIHEFGATVISYKSEDGRENLFVSRDAKLDGSKAIRGGIPLVFPIFGPPDSKSGSTMPQHGFARTNNWKIVDGSQKDTEEHATITFSLTLDESVVAGRGEHNMWSLEQAKVDGTGVTLKYEVTVAPKTLTTTMVVENTGSDAFNFQMLTHTYFAVDDNASQKKDECYVQGLGGYSVIDKVDDTKSGTTHSYDDNVVLDGETDRVYIHPEKHNTVHVTIGVGGGKTVKMEAYGEVDESPVPVSCVVWNPYKDKAAAMSDFGDDQYHDMICVEPGLIGHQPLLGPGKEARLTQIIFA
mmetsp:Transcript_6093/g.6743  ORF Transcript_6093/g.6743 Transcript_6093/m.6743 type:complete len:315 (-) Transcript_6093:53-997(-)